MAAKVNVMNLLTTIGKLSAFLPALATAVGVPESPLETAIFEAVPEIEKDIENLLQIFQKHAPAVKANS